MFAMKCLMNERPYLVVAVGSLLVSVLFGFAVQMAERVLYEDDDFSVIRRGDEKY